LLATQKPDFGPLGLRTSDFFALFAFQSQILINLTERYALTNGTAQPPYEAILGACDYDEMVKET